MNLATVTFEIPGLRKQDVGIDVHCNYVSVHGKTRPLTKPATKRFVTSERQFGSFSRSFKVPEGLRVRRVSTFLDLLLRPFSVEQPEEVIASLDNGVLTITYPLKASGRLPKMVPIV